MDRQVPLIIGETYHVFNRGAHKSAVFTSDSDHQRFLLLLFLCNTSSSVNMRDILQKYKGRTFAEIFVNEQRVGALPVGILAYSLMPNHFHLVLRQEQDNGITSFMRRVCTAYSMYFNTKYRHRGVLFQGKFKSSHIDNESYFRYIFSYVHLNPIDLVEKGWDEKGLSDPQRVRAFLNNYPYSSFYDYSVGDRPEGSVLIRNDVPDFLREQNDLDDLLEGYTAYAQELEPGTTAAKVGNAKVGPL